MQYIKLQLGCMLAVLYIVITYIRTTLKSKIPCNWLFDGLMIAAPQAIFFDGLTAWTVNHTGLVPDMVNRIAHLFFFLAMDVTVIITALYMYDQLIPPRKVQRQGLPGWAQRGADSPPRPDHGHCRCI